MSTESVDPKYQSYVTPNELVKRLENMQNLRPAPRVQGAHVALIVGSWHNYIVDRLLQGALDALNERGIDDASITIMHAPGAYEIPVIANKAAKSNQYQAIITLGAVIKGETPHFDYVAGECARGLAEVAREFELPIGFGVLTVNNVEQAMARAQAGESNKGREAVMAAIDTLSLLEQIK